MFVHARAWPDAHAHHVRTTHILAHTYVSYRRILTHMLLYRKLLRFFGNIDHVYGIDPATRKLGIYEGKSLDAVVEKLEPSKCFCEANLWCVEILCQRHET